MTAHDSLRYETQYQYNTKASTQLSPQHHFTSSKSLILDGCLSPLCCLTALFLPPRLQFLKFLRNSTKCTCSTIHHVHGVQGVCALSETYLPLVTGDMFWLAAVYSIFLSCTRRGCGRISLRTQLVCIWWRHLAVHLQYLCVTNGLIFFGALWYTRTHAQIQARAGGI